ncbi:RNA ligase family protein [Ideonella alba]|uniref:RNA ligase family protein n=1 Tax=Ideonella alba TaxID=2824118 RepID=A0A941BAX2_9BURK|nr:RNA ligase family protein [Ideonella alba]MBQ0930255.1 RNA ligase family protein [Ideonella alba]
MSHEFFRFPHTPHLAWLGAGEPRDDKVLSAQEAASLLEGEVTLEEKVDGANLGLSLGPDGALRMQNRGQYLHAPHAGQFTKLPAWLTTHGAAIADALLEHAQQLVLFGEWCAARHSLHYTRLPDWFLLFDVFEVDAGAGTGSFWSAIRRNALAARVGLATTPELKRGHFTVADLKRGIAQWPSRFRDGPLEGIVIRRESTQCCEQRAKLVRADFTQAIGEHWRSRRLEWNRLGSATA